MRDEYFMDGFKLVLSCSYQRMLHLFYVWSTTFFPSPISIFNLELLLYIDDSNLLYSNLICLSEKDFISMKPRSEMKFI